MSELTQDGTAEPVSRDQMFLRRERGKGRNNFLVCSAHHVYDWQPSRLILNLLIVMTNNNRPEFTRTGQEFFKVASGWRLLMYGHTYSKSIDQPGKVVNPARGQLNMENEYFSVSVRA